VNALARYANRRPWDVVDNWINIATPRMLLPNIGIECSLFYKRR